MPDPNFVNRTVWTGDNLDVLRGINSECVDLIYLDPPFNSNRQTMPRPSGSEGRREPRSRIRGRETM